jgi:anti-sigma regulatory factor (Ser/Thr protein kinase)
VVRQVLLLESHAEKASLREGQLRSLGFHPWICSSADDAGDYALRRLPDALLLGLSRASLPLLQRLRVHPRTNPLAVVLEGPTERSSLSVEPDAWLPPEARRSALLESLANALCHAERRRQNLIRSEVCWRLESSPDVLEHFATPFAQWAEACGLSGYAVKQLGSAVRELCANAMEWGNHFCPECPVIVTARLDEEKVSVLIRDTGSGFDRQHLPHAARRGDPLSHLSVRAAANLREGGFGILMASGLVDQLAYNDRGNEALVVKYLPPSVTHPLRHPGPLLASG